MIDTIADGDSIRRRFILEGNLWKLLVSASIPLVLYNTISQFFGVFDTLVASRLGADTVTTVAFISQIQSMLSAAGSGLAVGGGIIIARYFGAGDFAAARRNISTLVFLALGISVLLLLAILPFSVPILRLLGMPPELVASGTAYFMLESSLVVCIFLNTVYFAIEKALGNSRMIMYSTLLMLAVKLFFSYLFVYCMNGGILTLSAASLLSYGTITAIAIARMTGRGNAFGLSLRHADFSLSTLRPVFFLAIPVFFEKFLFSFGKVIVNSMSASYGSNVVGALGVSNRVGSISTTPPMGVSEAEASLVSQNLGNGDVKRALGIFKRAFAINMAIGVFFFILMSVFMDPVIGLFSGGDGEFAREIRTIYDYERYATILLAAAQSVMGLLYGFGYTRTAMVLNILRLFAYRIPPLWIMLNWTDLGSESVGIAMLVSNGLLGISATIVGILLVQKIRGSRLTAPLQSPD